MHALQSDSRLRMDFTALGCQAAPLVNFASRAATGHLHKSPRNHLHASEEIRRSSNDKFLHGERANGCLIPYQLAGGRGKMGVIQLWRGSKSYLGEHHRCRH